LAGSRFAIAAACIAVLLLALAGCSDDRADLRLVLPAMPLDRAIAEELARLLDADARLEIELVDGGGRSALDILAAGDADLALVGNNEPYHDDVAAVAVLYASVLHIAHRRGLVVEHLSDLLQGVRVNAGAAGSSSRTMLEAAAVGARVAHTEYAYTEPGDCADVAVIFAPVSPEIPARLAECGEAELFSLGAPADIGTGTRVDAIALLDPTLEPFIIPRSTYGAVTPRAIVTLAVDTLLVVRRGVPAAIVYDLVDELTRVRPALAALNPAAIRTLSDDWLDISGATFHPHPGARDFARRDEPDLFERYSGVAEVVVTIAIALVSASYAIARIVTRRRKNRIDTFYVDVIAARDGFRAGTTGRAEALADIGALEDRAFRMLVDEELAADESFRIFVTLAQNAVREIQERGTG
jgi:TRAP-type uncharacterized transport system substrate-binding protein